jgi:hypothetical protein
MPMLVAEQNHILARHADRVLTLIAGRLQDLDDLQAQIV